MYFTQPIKVHLMHADSVINAGLHAILSSSSEFAVSMPAATAYEQLDADVVITDYHRGISLSKHIRQFAAERRLRVLIVTQYDKEWEVRQAIDSGVHGYLLQSCVPDELADAVHLLSKGLHCLSDAVAPQAFEDTGRVALTGRETDVLHLLAKGYCNKLIARELGIGLGTVKTHVKGVMSKLSATARTHAVVVATQRGLLSSAAGIEARPARASLPPARPQRAETALAC